MGLSRVAAAACGHPRPTLSNLQHSSIITSSPLTRLCERVQILNSARILPSRRTFTSTTLRSSTPSSAITDKSRILEKPARFNPPSHGARRVRPRSYPGPRLSDAEAEAQKTRRYPNMMPPDGSFMYRFLTNRSLHLWITLSTLTSLALFAWFQSFLHTTIYRSELPTTSDALSHPITSLRRFLSVYKLHVAHESEQVATKRRRKLEDVEKRKEFLREHGVEPGFLTGTWMDKFGTVEGDEAKARARAEAGEVESGRGVDNASPQAVAAVAQTTGTDTSETRLPVRNEENTATPGAGNDGQGTTPTTEKKKVKMWLGIW